RDQRDPTVVAVGGGRRVLSSLADHRAAAQAEAAATVLSRVRAFAASADGVGLRAPLAARRARGERGSRRLPSPAGFDVSHAVELVLQPAVGILRRADARSV